MTTSTRGRRTTLEPTAVLCALLVGMLAVKLTVAGRLHADWVQAFGVVFAAVCIQATPFVVLGVLVSTAVRTLLPAHLLARVVPRRAACAVPVVGLAGLLLPGCECGSVPVARSLMAGGVAPAPAVAFLLAAPAINPVVLTATAVAFPGHPMMVLARFLASLGTAVVVGWVWCWAGRGLDPVPVEHSHRTSRPYLPAVAARELSEVLGLLIAGAALTAALKVALPRSWLDGARGSAVVGVVVLSVLAVVLAVCSEADAFIAASFGQFSRTGQLAFMVVGPMVDLKLIALQIGAFGSRFAVRLLPLTFLVAVLAAGVTGAALR